MYIYVYIYTYIAVDRPLLRGVRRALAENCNSNNRKETIKILGLLLGVISKMLGLLLGGILLKIMNIRRKLFSENH